MKNGIPIISGFDVKSEIILDSRNFKSTIAERDEIQNCTDGLFCFVLEDTTLYFYYGGQWNPYRSSGSGAFTYNFTLNLTGDQNSAENYLIRT